MDSFFGIGAGEFIFILILAGMVLGPQRIRDVARWLGKTTVQLQNISRGFTAQLNKELDSLDDGEIREALKEMQDLRRQVTELRQEFTSTVAKPINDAQSALNEGQEAFNQTILPPSLIIQDDEDSVTVEEKKDTAVSTNGTNLPKPIPPTQLPKILEIADDPE